MPLNKMDHVAIEVPSLVDAIEMFLATDGLRLLRRGTVGSTGASMAMLGDRVGMKIELIENKDASGLRFLHVAFRASDFDAIVRDAPGAGWRKTRGPSVIEAAKAQSAFFTCADDFEFQVVNYADDSPDLRIW